MYASLKPFLCRDLINLCCTLVHDEGSAAFAGDLESLKYLLQSRPKMPIKKIAKQAFLGKHFSILKWLKNDMEQMPHWDLVCLVNFVAINVGHLRFIRFLDQTLDQRPSYLKHVCTLLVEGGYLDALKYLHSRGKLDLTNSSIMWSAARTGHIKIVKWLRFIGLKCPSSLTLDEINEWSAFKGYSKLVKYFWHNMHIKPTIKVLRSASTGGGHLSLMKWMCKTADFGLVPDGTVYGYCVKNGRVDSLQWIKDTYPHLNFTANVYFVNEAAGKHLGSLEWLQLNDRPSLALLNGYAYVKAIWHGRLDILKWLKQNGPSIEPSEYARAAVLSCNNPDIHRWFNVNFP